jgi:hypothetical protein
LRKAPRWRGFLVLGYRSAAGRGYRARPQNAFGVLLSLNTVIEFGGAFDVTGADLEG